MMDTKTYQAYSMAEVLAEVKRELGRDAVILQTRRRRKGGLLGWIGGRCVWEIQAAGNTSIPKRPSKGLYVPWGAGGSPGESGEQSDSIAPTARLREVRDSFISPVDDGDDNPQTHMPQTHMTRKMNEIHGMLARLLSRDLPGQAESLPPELAGLYRHLLDQDVEQAIAAELMEKTRLDMLEQEMGDTALLEGRLTDLIAERITVAAPPPVRRGDRPYVLALIGPTGVGKTTTVAKLAANYKLREQKKVALISIDTYRIAAVDQLRTYAEIIQVPIQEALTPGELHGAIRKVADADVVLIDTAGRSQNDEIRLGELRRFIATVRCDEVHLVISAAGSWSVAKSAVDRFRPLGANRIVVTKLDEAATFGMVLNLSTVTDLVVSCITSGQEVPDDIAPADANILARCIVKGKWNGA